MIRIFSAIRHVLLALLLSQGSAQAVESVRLQLNWFHQFEFAGYYAAQEKGFYQAAGLDVTINEGGPHVDPSQQVASGRADFGVGSTNVLADRARGMDLVILGVVFQHSPAVLLTLRDSGIRTLKDLAGKRLIDSPNAGDVVAMLKRAGVDYAKLKKVEHSGNPTDLLENKAEAMIAYSTNEPYVLEEKGAPYRIFSARGSGIDFYGSNFFTSGDTLRKRAETVQAFREASLRGWQYALTHQEEMIDLILRKYSTKKSRAALQFEANQTLQLIQPDLIELGYQSASRWNYIASVHEDIGQGQIKAGLDGLLYDPTPPPDNTRLLIIMAGLLAASLILGFIATMHARLNRRLRKEIDERVRAENDLRIHRDHLFDLVSAQTKALVHAKEVAEAANVAKDVFLSNMSHELRTPMHQILGLTQIGREKVGNLPEQKQLHSVFNHIQTAGQRIERLVADLLDLTHRSSGDSKAGFAQHDLVQLCDNAIKAEHEPATRKDVEFHLTAPASAPIFCDGERIEQMIRYLLGNAIQYSPAGGHIEIRIVSEQEAWKLTVSDRGVGIPEAELESIFEAFVQGSRTSTGAGGKGLGLAVCRQITTRHGGSIRAYNNEPQGAVIEAIIPF